MKPHRHTCLECSRRWTCRQNLKDKDALECAYMKASVCDGCCVTLAHQGE